jgi:hypothetical protein
VTVFPGDTRASVMVLAGLIAQGHHLIVERICDPGTLTAAELAAAATGHDLAVLDVPAYYETHARVQTEGPRAVVTVPVPGPGQRPSGLVLTVAFDHDPDRRTWDPAVIALGPAAPSG